MNDDDSTKKFFTVEDANRTLPLVRAIVRDVVEQFEDVHERRDRLARIRQMRSKSAAEDSVYDEELQQIEEELEKDVVKLEGYVDELRQLGVELKDPVQGLVDFPHLMDGREVCLCWKLGEEEIASWHEVDAGFSGRQSLLEESVSPADAGTHDSED